MNYVASLSSNFDNSVNRVLPLHTKEEVSKLVVTADDLSEITFEQDFLDKYFTPESFLAYTMWIKQCNPYIRVTNDVIEDKEDSQADLDTLLASVYNLDDLLDIVRFNKKDVVSEIKRLATISKEKSKDSFRQASYVAALRSQMANLQLENENLRGELQAAQDKRQKAQVQLEQVITNINFYSNTNFALSRYINLPPQTFKNILYFKEISRVQYTDTFIQMLQEILRLRETIPVKLIVIESDHALDRIRLYPNCKSYLSLTEYDIFNSDIVMLGLQKELLNSILSNPRMLTTCIILDRTGYLEPCVIGSSIQYFYIASDSKDVPVDVPKERIISYTSGTSNIPYYKEYESLSLQEQLSRYSSSNIMASIMSTVKY